MPYRLYSEQRATIYGLEQRLTPKINLSFRPNAEGLAQTPIEIRQALFGSPQIAIKEFMATYGRIRVVASSDITVTGCKSVLDETPARERRWKSRFGHCSAE